MTDTQYSPPPAPTQKGSNGLAVAGFVLALIGFLGSWVPLLNFFAAFLGVIGLVLAGIGLAKSGKAGTGKGLAITGLILGALSVIIAIVVNVAFVAGVDEALNEATDTKVEAADGDSDGTATDSDAGSTRSNPAPLGSKISGGDWTVVINSVKTINEDSLGARAESGKVLLSVNLTATYDGDDEQGETAWATVKFVSPDGTTVDSTSGSTLFIEENGFDSLKTLYNGGSITGDRILEVPADWEKGVLAVSPGMFSDDTFVAIK